MTPPTHADAILAALAVRGLLHLVDAVCSRRGVTRDELCGPGRTRAVTSARHELWWLVRHHPERRYSYHEIARLFRREPSTVVCGVAAHHKRYAPSLADG